MGAAENCLTGPQVLSLVQIKPVGEKLWHWKPTYGPARLYAVGNQMLQTSTTQYMHSASGTPHIKPIVISVISRSRKQVCVFWKQGSFCRDIYHRTLSLGASIPRHTLMTNLLHQSPIRYANDIILQPLKIKFKKLFFVLFLPLPKWTGLVLANPKALFPLSQDKICILLSS